MSANNDASDSTHTTPVRSGGAPDAVAKSYEIAPSHPLITIFVGPKRKEFKIYKDLLIAKSQFFKNALKDDWGHNNEVYLDKEDTEAFGILIDWMFKDDFSLTKSDEDLVDLPQHATAYCLADFLMMPKAKNDMVNAVLEWWTRTGKRLNFLGLRRVCEGGATGTALFKLSVRSATYMFMSGDKVTKLHGGISNYPLAMFAVLESIEQWHIKPWKAPQLTDKCTYHDHTDGSKCE